METPLEHILSSFDGLTYWHFIPVLIIGIPVVIISVLRRRRPKHYTWARGKGWTPRLEAVLANTPPEELKEVAARIGLDETDLEELKNRAGLEPDEP